MTTSSEKELYSNREILRDIQLSLAKIETHNEYTQAAIMEHKGDIDKLKSAHNKQKGALALLGLIGLAGLEELIRNGLK